MYILRPIEEKDFDAYQGFAFAASLGLFNLPKNPELLRNRIRKSLASFSKKTIQPEDELYVFVLEELKTGYLAGTSAILSKTAIEAPTYFYKVDYEQFLDRRVQTLTPTQHRKGESELCGLFMSHESRKEGLGRLLSLSRLLFIAAFPSRFESKIIAELRGVIEKNYSSPFWTSLGSKFLPVPLPKALSLFEQRTLNIPSILPQHPIYSALLTKKAQKVIGTTHVHTLPARKMLEGEGFCFSGEIDLFDGGPKMEAETKKLLTIRESTTAKVQEIVSTLEGEKEKMMSNDQIDFRSCVAPLALTGHTDVTLDHETAHALKVKVGDCIRYVREAL